MLDKRERALLLSLVANGSTTEAASELGLSERHTRRLLRALQARAGANNPYHLVARAVVDNQIAETDLPAQ